MTDPASPAVWERASARALVLGKLPALSLVVALVGLPAMIAFLLIAGQPGALAGPMLVIALGYGAYLTPWSVIVILVSGQARRGADATHCSRY